MALQAKHNIITESYGGLTPILRHSGGPLKPVLKRIADRLSSTTGKNFDSTSVLILWIQAQGAIAVTSSKAPDRIKLLGEISTLPDLLEKSEIEEISNVGKTVHFRHYVGDFICVRLVLTLSLEGTYAARLPSTKPPFWALTYVLQFVFLCIEYETSG